MRLIEQGGESSHSRKRRQDVLSLRHALLKVSGICRECRKDLPFPQLNRRPRAMLCSVCVEARLDRLSADAL